MSSSGSNQMARLRSRFKGHHSPMRFAVTGTIRSNRLPKGTLTRLDYATARPLGFGYLRAGADMPPSILPSDVALVDTTGE